MSAVSQKTCVESFNTYNKKYENTARIIKEYNAVGAEGDQVEVSDVGTIPVKQEKNIANKRHKYFPIQEI